MRPAESQPEQEPYLNHGMYVSCYVGSCGHLKAELLGHRGVVLQWVAYGHIAVIGHGCQQKALSPTQCHKHLHLDSTAQE